MRPEVETAQGRVAGTEVRGIRVFRGIPFASFHPLGARRFHGPDAPEPWTGTLEATRPGPVAHQASLPLMSFMNAGGARQSESCLHLNVWTPGLDGAKRPVLMWLHGGGFLIGAGSTRVYDGHSLAQRGDLVVVTFNYRLGALGFLHLSIASAATNSRGLECGRTRPDRRARMDPARTSSGSAATPTT